MQARDRAGVDRAGPVASLDPVRRVGVTRRHALTLGAAAGLGALLGPAPGASGARLVLPARREPSGFGMDVAGAELPGADGLSAVLRAPRRFDLVGVRHGPARLELRTRRRGGTWSPWAPLHAHGDHAPDVVRGGESGRPSDPVWVGGADELQLRAGGPVHQPLRLHFVAVGDAPDTPKPAPVARAAQVGGPGTPPPIIPRSAWGGDAVVPREAPSYGEVQVAFVHHTVTTTAYAPSQSAGIVLGIAKYHRDTNGWNDIGYNFLVDRYGQVFEGRAGGIDRNVIGAQAEGFNTGSVGVALIGNYQAASVQPTAARALAALFAWRLDVAHVDPLGTVNWVSGGNPRFKRGTTVTLRAISGHRDTGFTSCPGTRLYAKIPDLAHRVAAIGLPKLYAPTVKRSLGGAIVFGARLSQAESWTVTVRDAAGTVVARGTGRGATIAWTWNSAGRRGGDYTWTMEAGPATRPAQGTLGRVPAPAPPPAPAPILTGLLVDPPVISPDGDGVADTLTISYALAGRAAVTATVADAASGAVVATLFDAQFQGARTQSFPYAAPGLADGTYRLTISAVGEDGRTGRAQASFAIDRTLSGLVLSTPTITPNGDGVDDSLGIGFTLAASAYVTIQIEQVGAVVASVFAGPLPPGSQQVVWDATIAGTPAAAGAYVVAVIVGGPFGETRHEAAVTVAR
jgi:hypothetical protein